MRRPVSWLEYQRIAEMKMRDAEADEVVVHDLTLPEAVRIDRGQGSCLSKTSQSQLSTRHFPHGAWSFSEWPQVHIPSLPIL